MFIKYIIMAAIFLSFITFVVNFCTSYYSDSVLFALDVFALIYLQRNDPILACIGAIPVTFYCLRSLFKRMHEQHDIKIVKLHAVMLFTFCCILGVAYAVNHMGLIMTKDALTTLDRLRQEIGNQQSK